MPRAGGYWFDLCRVDALAHFLLVAGAALLLADGGSARLTLRRGLVDLTAGLLLAASLLAKQTGLAAAIALLPAIALQSGRRAVPFAAGLAAGPILPGMALHAASDGWFWTRAVAAVWARAHAGSYDNVFLGAHWFAILALARPRERCFSLPIAADLSRVVRSLAAGPRSRGALGIASLRGRRRPTRPPRRMI